MGTAEEAPAPSVEFDGPKSEEEHITWRLTAKCEGLQRELSRRIDKLNEERAYGQKLAEDVRAARAQHIAHEWRLAAKCGGLRGELNRRVQKAKVEKAALLEDLETLRTENESLKHNSIAQEWRFAAKCAGLKAELNRRKEKATREKAAAKEELTKARDEARAHQMHLYRVEAKCKAYQVEVKRRKEKGRAQRITWKEAAQQVRRLPKELDAKQYDIVRKAREEFQRQQSMDPSAEERHATEMRNALDKIASLESMLSEAQQKIKASEACATEEETSELMASDLAKMTMSCSIM